MRDSQEPMRIGVVDARELDDLAEKPRGGYPANRPAEAGLRQCIALYCGDPPLVICAVKSFAVFDVTSGFEYHHLLLRAVPVDTENLAGYCCRAIVDEGTHQLPRYRRRVPTDHVIL